MIQQFIIGRPIPEWEEIDNWDTEMFWGMECPGRPFFYIIQAGDMVEMCGEEEAAEMSGDSSRTIAGDLFLVLHPMCLPEKERLNVLEQMEIRNMDEFHEKYDESYMWLALEAARYGLSAPVKGAWGTDFEDTKSRILEDFNPLMDIEPILTGPVNKIGTPGLAMMVGELYSGNTRQMKTGSVNQGNLTSECWQVQTWGFAECLNCDELLGDGCGGQEIWKTGKNSKGLWVPV